MKFGVNILHVISYDFRENGYSENLALLSCLDETKTINVKLKICPSSNPRDVGLLCILLHYFTAIFCVALLEVTQCSGLTTPGLEYQQRKQVDSRQNDDIIL